MPDYKKPNQQRDSLSRYMRQRLKDHQLPPDELCWDEIEQRLIKRNRRLYIRRGLCVAGAAIFVLLLWIHIPTSEKTDSITNEAIEEIANNEVKTIDPIELSPLNEDKPLYQSPKKTPEKTVAKTQITVNETEKVEVSEKNPEQERIEITADANVSTTTESPPLLPGKKVLFIPGKNRQRKSWQISAGLLAMGNLLNNENLLGMQGPMNSDYNAWIPLPPDYDLTFEPGDCDDISYNLPLSFGITIRKELGRKVSLETGLVYTYLSTGFEANNTALVKSKLGLHYLGIPFNLVFDLWNNTKWDVYASAGIMVEKGLRSVYTQHLYYTTREEKSVAKTSIPGLQWSLSGSLGVSYRLHKDWSLYAEPRMSYYMDNNQPISIRTHKPFTLGIGLGIRYDL